MGGTVSGNAIWMDVNSAFNGGGIGVDLEAGATAAISGNSVINSDVGVQAASPNANISGNSLLNGYTGVAVSSNNATINSNTFQEIPNAISACTAPAITAEKNKINDAQGVGIFALTGSTLTGNVFNNVGKTTVQCN